MAKNILSKIKWGYFMEHPIVKSFIETQDEESFLKNLKEFIDGDEDFHKNSGINSLTNQDVVLIMNEIRLRVGRRKFIKTAVKIGAAAVAGYAIDKLGVDLSGVIGHGRLAIKGINYDVGTQYTPTYMTRSEFGGINTSIMQRELRVIRTQLNCNAVRICGEDISKLIECSRIALSYGLQVWLSPRLINGNEYETIKHVKRCAIEAEKLRIINPNIIFIVGNELIMDMKSIISGQTYQERGSNLAKNVAIGTIRDIFGESPINQKLNDFLRNVVSEVKPIFKGNMTYASHISESVDWSIFDIISINAYRNKATDNIFFSYKGKLERLKKFKKPIAVTEFGCGSYKGAEYEAGFGYINVDWDKNPPEIKGNKKRDENVQANYLLDLLNLFVNERIYATFPWTFVETQYTCNENDPKHDLDIASFNLIKVYPEEHERSYADGHIIPKKAFVAVADFYAKH